jgi:hypothetical protein
MTSVSDIPIWSFQKSVMTGIGKSVNWSADSATSRRGFDLTGGCAGPPPPDVRGYLPARSFFAGYS